MIVHGREACSKNAVPVLKKRRKSHHDGKDPENGEFSKPLFRRDDWTLFRNLQTIGQRAGVPVAKIPAVVIKELADNALDAAGDCSHSWTQDGWIIVANPGAGLPGTDEDIASLFSVARPLTSSKLIRLPTRGALGNGLRVVVGAALATGGQLVVKTRGRALRLRPRDVDGGTDVKRIGRWTGKGTEIRVRFGDGLSADGNSFDWARTAVSAAPFGRYYKGRTSAHWYDSDSFYELLQAAGDRTVRSLVEDFDGCSGRKAGEVAADFLNRTCNSLTRDEADALLLAARKHSSTVEPRRLGLIGDKWQPLGGSAYAKHAGCFSIRPARGRIAATIPYVVEAWVVASDATEIVVLVNRTPITAELVAGRFMADKTAIGIQGCGLSKEHKNTATGIRAGRKGQYQIIVNVTTPYMPITGDGKAPDLSHFTASLRRVLEKAIRRAKPPVSKPNNALPRRKRGRQTSEDDAAYDADLERFALKIQRIASRLDFRPSSRGYGYILENEGAITKGDFAACQTLINDCRKRGVLPLDICCEDARRQFHGIENIDEKTPEEFAQFHLGQLLHVPQSYLPLSFWEDQPYYLQMLVEKIDLRQLFRPVCERFHVPIANAAGWSDLNLRAAMMQRFAHWEAKGKTCVLLYAGDFDPAGMRISDFLMGNMCELKGAVGWNPENVIIDRFGLNQDFIEDNGLSWIDGLTTGSGSNLADPKHRDHNQPYVQEWLREIGPRKVEANTLVVAPEAGRELCRQAITKYVPDDAPAQFISRLDLPRGAVQKAITTLVTQPDWDKKAAKSYLDFQNAKKRKSSESPPPKTAKPKPPKPPKNAAISLESLGISEKEAKQAIALAKVAYDGAIEEYQDWLKNKGRDAECTREGLIRFCKRQRRKRGAA